MTSCDAGSPKCATKQGAPASSLPGGANLDAALQRQMDGGVHLAFNDDSHGTAVAARSWEQVFNLIVSATTRGEAGGGESSHQAFTSNRKGRGD